MMHALRTLLCFCCLTVVSGGAALAHKGSDAYLDVQQVNGVAPDYRFTLSVAIKDLDQVLPLDADADGKVTWGEVKNAMPQVLALLNKSANTERVADALATGQVTLDSCHLAWKFDGVERRGDGAYLRLAAQGRCTANEPLAFKYTLFRDQDATHRLLVAGRIAGNDLLTTARPQQVTSLVLRAGGVGVPDSAATASALSSSSRWAALWDYAGMGMRHLLEGFDHLAFLLALVLPLRLRLGRSASRRVWVSLLRTVTAFTIGHSITLMLATLGWTQASPQWVEPVIALSIAVTAGLNLRPVPWLRTDVLALVFGLVHGFGFAGLLLEAAAPDGLLPWALAGFNLGIEAGQLFAVGLWVVASQVLVNKAWYHRGVVQGGSVLLMLMAAWWFWQRVN
jgi:hypothetical protein